MRKLTIFLLLSVWMSLLNAQWVQTNGPEGGVVHSLAINGSNLFAGTDGGVFRSTNNGTSWSPVGLRNASVWAFAVSGTNLFAGTDGGGVFLSTDNGSSWTAVNSGLTTRSVHTLATSGSSLFAGTEGGGVFRSTDNGSGWTAVNSGLTGIYVYSLAVGGTDLFAGTYDAGVFRSTDNGSGWTAVNSGLTNTNVYALAVGGTDLFAGINGGGVFRSSDNGSSWTAANSGLTNNGVRALAVSGSNLFAGTLGGGVFLSTDNGTSWTGVNSGLTSASVYCLAISGSNLFAGTYSGGVFLSTDNGGNWTAVNSGLTNTSIQSFAVSGANVFAGTNGNIFLSTNNGNSWTAVYSGLPPNAEVTALTVSSTNLFAGTWGWGVFRSTNNGSSWTAVNSGLTNTSVSALAVSGPNLFAGTNGGVFFSTDNGNSWVAVNSGLGNTYVHSLAASGANLFAGTDGGVFLSANNGSSWTAVNSGLTSPSVYCLAVSGINLFAGTNGGGVFLSTDNGSSWTAVNSGLTNTYVYSLAVSGTNIFAATWSAGVYLSTDNGSGWTHVNSGLTIGRVPALAVSGTNIFAGTVGGGVWRRPLSEFGLPQTWYVNVVTGVDTYDGLSPTVTLPSTGPKHTISNAILAASDGDNIIIDYGNGNLYNESVVVYRKLTFGVSSNNGTGTPVIDIMGITNTVTFTSPLVLIEGIALSSGSVIGAGNLTLADNATVSYGGSQLDGVMVYAGRINLVSAVGVSGTTIPSLLWPAAPSTLVTNLQVGNGPGVVVFLPGSRTVNGNVTISTGTLDIGANTLSVAGDFNVSSGTFAASTGTVSFNGSSDQTINGVRVTFNNLTLSKPSGTLILGGADSVNGTLSLGANKIVTGSNTLAMGYTGTFARTTGYVAGNLQKSAPTGSNVSLTFEIGDASNYTPVNLTSANVLNGGNLVANTTGSVHPDILHSGISSTKYVNRYWTLTNRGVVLGGTFDATFNFQPGDISGSAVPTNFIVAKNTTGTWTRPTVGSKTATSTQTTGLTSFSDFALGESSYTILVTNTNDADAGSLRQAILDANATPGLNEIHFNIPGSGPFTIQPASALPTISDPVIIDGTTQPGYSGTPIVELDGSGAGAGASGLTVTCGGCTVRGLVVNRFNQYGIFIQSGGSNVIAGNFVGTDRTGTVASPNTNGIQISNSASNTVGGLTPQNRNIVSGNDIGINIFGTGSDGNNVIGNYVGTNKDGTSPIPNNQGVWITDGKDNVIGGSSAAARNVISGNNDNGIWIQNIGATRNSVRGNYIGLTLNGTDALGNKSFGVKIHGSAGNTIGGPNAGDGNVISANGTAGLPTHGVLIEYEKSGTGNIVQGNLIGTDATGTLGRGNVSAGVCVLESSHNTILNNVIADNNRGILIWSADDSTGSNYNSITGNLIGTKANGTQSLGNHQYGVVVRWSHNNTIGGTSSASRNIISGNGILGVLIGQGQATGNKVQGNYVGLDINGTTALPNGSAQPTQEGGGVDVFDATANIVGGSGTGAANVISGNVGYGILIDRHLETTTNNLVQNNLIGTDATGTLARGNTSDGVHISVGAANNIIGGGGAGEGNLISGNGTNGVFVTGPASNGNWIQGNRIGTDKDGLVPLGNILAGIRIDSAANNTIGGAAAGARNIISGNGWEGLSLRAGAAANTVSGNYVGTDVTGTQALGNGFADATPGFGKGIFIYQSSNNTIGGAAPGAGNLISGNAGSGIAVIGSPTNGNVIKGNLIGTNASGTKQLGNTWNGIVVSYPGTTLPSNPPALSPNNNAIGGTAPGEGNVIAFNQKSGVVLISGTGNSIPSNSIYQNGALGIDLGGSGNIGDGVTMNDPGDADVGANNLQNFPVITSAKFANDQLTVAGTLNSSANTTFAVQIFASDVVDPSGYGEGRTLIRSFTLATDGSGNASFNDIIASPASVGPFITATATDPANNTSEFSKALALELQTPAGYVSEAYASGLKKPVGLAFDQNHKLLVAESETGIIYRYDNGTTRTIVADHFTLPIDLVVVGNLLYVSDFGRGGIYQVDLNGTLPVNASGLTPIVGSLNGPTFMQLGPSGDLFVSIKGGTSNDKVIRIALSSSTATDFLTFGASVDADPQGIVFSPTGEMYVCAQLLGTVPRVPSNPTPPVIAGTLSSALEGLDSPAGIALGSDDRLYVATKDNIVVSRRDSKVWTPFYAGLSGGLLNNIEYAGNGEFYVADYAAGRILRVALPKSQAAPPQFPIVYKMNNVGHPDITDGSAFTAIRNAFQHWTGLSTCAASFQDGGMTSLQYASMTDGVNLVTFTDDQFPFPPGVLAVAAKTLQMDPGQQTATIIDADVVFNPEFVRKTMWGLSSDTYPGLPDSVTFDIESIATHEIGHILGLVHSGVPTASMFFVLQPGKNGRSLKPDDIAWASYQYPAGNFTSAYGSIEGMVKYGYNETTPVAGALLIALNASTGAYYHAYSDVDGKYHIPGLPAGNYYVLLRALNGKVFGYPMTPANVSAYLYAITSITDYPGEWWNQAESSTDNPHDSTLVTVVAGGTKGSIDFITNVDLTGPTVAGVFPANNAASVDVFTQVVLTFSEAVSPASITGTTLKVSSSSGSVAGTFLLMNNNTTVTITPAQPLRPTTVYTITASSGITDLRGNPLTPFSGTFTTGQPDPTPPAVAQVVPEQSAIGVYVTSPVVVRFSKSMDPNTITTSTFTVANSTSISGKIVVTEQNTIATFTPDQLLSEGITYTVRLTTGVKDPVGNSLPSVFTSTFTTVTNAQPTVVEIGPANNATGISVTTPILVDFSKPIDVGTVNSQTIALSASGSPVAGTFEFLKENARVIFRPSAPLQFNTLYQINISTDIKDRNNRALDRAWQSGFKTAPFQQTPIITSIDPPAATAGTTVVISGNGFDPDPTKNIVTFNNIIAGASSSSLTSTTVVVPDGVGAGIVNVKLTSHDASGAYLFDVLLPLLNPQDNIIAGASTGSQPKDAEITPDGTYAYVTNFGSNTVSVIGLTSATPTVGQPIPVGKNPYRIAITSDGKYAYVTNYGSNSVSVIDISTKTVTGTIPVGMNPMGIAIATAVSKIYVANSGSNTISVIDGDPNSGAFNQIIAGASTNSSPRDVDVSPDGTLAFVTAGNALLIIDMNPASDTFNKIIGQASTSSETRDVSVTPDGTMAVVTTKDGSVLLINVFPKSPGFGEIIAGAATNSEVERPAPSPDGSRVYVTSRSTNSVLVYNFAYAPGVTQGTVSSIVTTAVSLKYVKAIQVGSAPEGIAIDPRYRKIVVVNSGSNNASIIQVSGVDNYVLETLGRLVGQIQTLIDQPGVSKLTAGLLKQAQDAVRSAVVKIGGDNISQAFGQFQAAVGSLVLASSSKLSVSDLVGSLVAVADTIAQDALTAARAYSGSLAMKVLLGTADLSLRAARSLSAKTPWLAMVSYQVSWEASQSAIKLASQTKGNNQHSQTDKSGSVSTLSELALAENYPNPFNSTTQIVFDIPITETGGIFVELRVYNILGQLVRTLVNEVKSPGRYIVTWNGKQDDGRPTASGMYLVRFKAGKFQQTRRVVLIQ